MDEDKDLTLRVLRDQMVKTLNGLVHVRPHVVRIKPLPQGDLLKPPPPPPRGACKSIFDKLIRITPHSAEYRLTNCKLFRRHLGSV